MSQKPGKISATVDTVNTRDIFKDTGYSEIQRTPGLTPYPHSACLIYIPATHKTKQPNHAPTVQCRLLIATTQVLSQIARESQANHMKDQSWRVFLFILPVDRGLMPFASPPKITPEKTDGFWRERVWRTRGALGTVCPFAFHYHNFSR